MSQHLKCQQCGAADAHTFHQWTFATLRELALVTEQQLCTACARSHRQQLRQTPSTQTGLTRDELIAQLDQFFTTSGVFDICRRCHEQGTGCCPPTCRILQAPGQSNGCQSGKTLYCATFLCSALLNAISECDVELGRLLKWLKTEVGVTEWRVYEMFTRVPLEHREPERPLILPESYPLLPTLEGQLLRHQLMSLADEVLALRRQQEAT
ncbi:MAG: hypothetical protein HOP19_04280 [Acidobacteria bacterium]|nr:hypothetical protein [Acidobacteriota bacterium]